MPANEDRYEPADETVFEVWTTADSPDGGIVCEWQYTQTSLDDSESVVGAIEDDLRDCVLSIDIYETTRRRVGGKTYEAPGEEAE